MQESDRQNTSINVWKARPMDLLKKHRKDRVLTIAIGAIKFIEISDALSRWSIDKITPVERVLEGEIIKREELADGVVSLVFKNANGGLFPSWKAGAHIDLLLPSGRKRQYSLTGTDTRRDEYRIAIRKIPNGGGGSIEVHETLQVGDIIKFEGPRSAFHYVTRAGKVVFVAGGIGITPILPMLRDAQRSGVDWELFYAGRSRSSMPFLDQLSAFDQSRITIWADDERGTSATAQDMFRNADEQTSVYVCGPTPMLNLILTARSNPQGALYYERFSPPPVVDEEPFELVLARSRKTLQVPGDRSALAVVVDEEIPMTYSCRQGFCGTCKVKVLEGKVKLKGSPTFENNHEILLCMSRAADDKLVIDL